MATVIPDSALNDRAYGINTGEKYLLKKLKEALPDDCLVWHNIDLPNHYQPDIVAYVPRLGIIIFEVKDWAAQTINTIEQDFWEIQADGHTKRIKSPLEQVRAYYFELAQLFQKKGILLREDGNYKGSFRLPIAHVVAFTNMRRSDMPENARQHLDPQKFIFRNELEPLGNTVTGPKAVEFLRTAFGRVFWPTEPLNAAELDSLRG
ncbi:MAG: nuclease-related domain-containing protein, partial [Nitrospiraceae bacterium]|nr:nuclease-related domain-containing protein [Nitrospiraceae bacterium]